MNRILWIAPYVPYKSVNHAGGKNLNYYIEYFNSTNNFDITFIGLGYEWEREKVSLDNDGIKTNIYYRDSSIVDYVIRRIVSSLSLLNYKSKYYHLLLKYERLQLQNKIKDYTKDNHPDIVILQWTAMGLMMPWIKKLFPDAKYIIIEEDVSYLGFERKYKANSNSKKLKYQYGHLKKDELKIIMDADLTVTMNNKDRNLLIHDGIPEDKVMASSSYIDNYSDVNRNPDDNRIMFYGSMERSENYEAAIWFIDNVMPLLPDNYVFEIVGSKPADKLINAAEKYNKENKLASESELVIKNDRIKSSDPVRVEGFVKDIRPFLEKSTCLVAPLLMGAGIKIKVLEAMSAGMPVLTNDIGIEGIAAENNVEYIHCTTPREYADNIIALCNNMKQVSEIGSNARAFIEREFNTDQKIEELMKRILICTQQ